MLRVAIVGCGKIADAHASQIQRIKDCEIVAVCDREPLMAKQLCDRFPIKQHFTELKELLRTAQPEVVHITTPPKGHFELAKLSLEHGANVYIEKPFTVYADQAQKLIDLAENKGLKLTAGHNCQFSPAARRMRELVKSGYLGENVVHVESYYSGKLLQNIISHGIARIAEFLTTDTPQVIAYGFVSPVLKSIGETEIIDELRVIISDEERTTAYFTFSSQMKPSIHELRVFGSKNGLVLDDDHDILLKLRGSKYKNLVDKFVPPVQLAKQHFENLITNVKLFMANDFHMDSGMKYLMESFYRSIREDAPVPIPYREILLTTRIMDEVFEQLEAKEPQDRLTYQARQF